MILNLYVYWDSAGALPFINKIIPIVENMEDASTFAYFIHCEILAVLPNMQYANADIISIKSSSVSSKICIFTFPMIFLRVN